MKQVGRMMVLVTVPGETLKCGVVCGRKFSKKAVVRNRMRRLVMESFRLLKAGIAPCHLVIIPRVAMNGAMQPMVQKEMCYLLKKAGKLICPPRDTVRPE